METKNINGDNTKTLKELGEIFSTAVVNSGAGLSKLESTVSLDNAELFQTGSRVFKKECDLKEDTDYDYFSGLDVIKHIEDYAIEIGLPMRTAGYFGSKYFYILGNEYNLIAADVSTLAWKYATLMTKTAVEIGDLEKEEYLIFFRAIKESLFKRQFNKQVNYEKYTITVGEFKLLMNEEIRRNRNED